MSGLGTLAGGVGVASPSPAAAGTLAPVSGTALQLAAEASPTLSRRALFAAAAIPAALAVGAAVAAGAAIAAESGAVATRAPADPDADLVAWCAEATAIEAECERRFARFYPMEPGPEWDDPMTGYEATYAGMYPLRQRLEDLISSIVEARAMTVRGVLAKAMLLRFVIDPTLQNGPDPGATNGMWMAWSLVQDMVAPPACAAFGELAPIHVPDWRTVPAWQAAAVASATRADAS
jgi:hypothetical protein